MNEIIFIALSAALPIILTRLISRYFDNKNNSTENIKPLLSTGEAWLLCFPGFVMFLIILFFYNLHLQDRYPTVLFCSLISVSTWIAYGSKRYDQKKKVFFWLRCSAVVSILFSIAALTITFQNYFRGAFLILSLYFLGLSIGLMLVGKLSKSN
ncbi:MAG: hypothetical protein Q7U04_14550 [Bacteriovorax sp.]|nr:hypothetical protein [Bacteriovorax sp.]